MRQPGRPFSAYVVGNGRQEIDLYEHAIPWSLAWLPPMSAALSLSEERPEVLEVTPVSLRAAERAGRTRADFLYRKYGVVVYRCCARLLRDPEAAKDATQEVFIKLLKNVDALEQDEHAVSWVYRVATNHCLNVRRDGARETSLEPGVEVAGRAQPSFPDLHLVRSILARFDAQTRAIAVGAVVEEMDHEEIADSLGVSTRTVARKLKRFFEHSRKFVARTDSDDDPPRGANT